MTKLLNLLDKADNLYASSCDESISEDAQDQAYLDYHDTVKQIATGIEKLLSGKIDRLSAERMAHFKRDEIKALVARTV
jgi:hypothetical protein